MPRQGAAATASHHLPGAMALLALSIAALVVVLANMERGRERRSQDRGRRDEVASATAPNDTFSTAVTAAAAPADDDDTLRRSAAAPAVTATTTTTGRGRSSLREGDSSLLRSRGRGDFVEGMRDWPALAVRPQQPPPVRNDINNNATSSSSSQGNAATNSPLQLAPSIPTSQHSDRPATTLAAVSLPTPRLEVSSPFAAGQLPAAASPSSSSVNAAPVMVAMRELVPSAGGERLELLVHNVSHKDMVLSLRRSQLAARPRLGEEPGTSSIDAPDTALARPKFSLFKPSSELILNKIVDMRAVGESEPPPAFCAVYRRGEAGAPSSEQSPTQPRNDMDEDRASLSPQQKKPLHGQRRLSVGFDFDAAPIPVADLAGYRVRSEDLDRLAPPPGVLSSGTANQNVASSFQHSLNRRDSSGAFMRRDGDQLAAHAGWLPRGGGIEGVGAGGGQRWGSAVGLGGFGRRSPDAESRSGGQEGGMGDEVGGEAYISGVYFPLLSVLVPKWMEQLAGNGDDDSAKTILLVSGVGQPRNQKHRVEDNSTEVTALLMETFLKRHYPDVRVVRVHSNTNIFRYDDNIRFVKTELLPLLNAERSQMAEKYGDDWQDMMHITMSFADGSPARISSINTALRHFRPSFIHIWELKTFWHEKTICEDDVEVHTFEDIDMMPPIPASEVDSSMAIVIAEMLRLKGDLERILASPPCGGVVGGDTRDDLASFWLRKTKKAVLAVLLVQKKGGEPQLHRGTNMEVSMPTGSLCAERNVIGSALAADLSLLRRDIKAVAVLGMGRVGKAPSSAVVANEEDGNSSSAVGAAAAAGSGRGGFDSSVTSVIGSSVPSCVASPLVLTPALRGSPVRRRRAWCDGEGGGGGACRHGGGVSDARGKGDGGEDKKCLEGVRQALFAVAAKEKINLAPGRAVCSDNTISNQCSTTTSSQLPGPFMTNDDVNDGNEDDDVVGGGGGGWRKQEGEGRATDEEATALVAGEGERRANPRFRSESCADELLAAGRVTSREAFGDYDDREGTGGAAPNKSNNESGGGLADVAGAFNVRRSHSFDLGTGGGNLRASLNEEYSRRKVLRGTKLVRSISGTPTRDQHSEGAIGDIGNDGTSNKVKAIDGERAGDGKGTSGGGGGVNNSNNRGSVVARVPAEPLCPNPLKPCGACMEWLKKIAEVNPDFKVITFTDSRCSGVYIEDVAQIV